MAVEAILQKTSKIAASDYSAKQYFACVLDANGQAALPSSGADVYGVVQDKPAVGRVTAVATAGVTKWVAGAAVAAGALVMTDGAGKCITATSTNYAVGIAEQAASGNNIVISVALIRGGKV
jgi:hypothetical protein